MPLLRRMPHRNNIARASNSEGTSKAGTPAQGAGVPTYYNRLDAAPVLTKTSRQPSPTVQRR
jgi:hypothetical protein